MTNAEILLALRSPDSGWLAAVVCALDEAMMDPTFDDVQRGVVRHLLDRNRVPGIVAVAAHAGLLNFESATQAQTDGPDFYNSTPPCAPRQKLTLAVCNS